MVIQDVSNFLLRRQVPQDKGKKERREARMKVKLLSIMKNKKDERKMTEHVEY